MSKDGLYLDSMGLRHLFSDSLMLDIVCTLVRRPGRVHTAEDIAHLVQTDDRRGVSDRLKICTELGMCKHTTEGYVVNDDSELMTSIAHATIEADVNVNKIRSAMKGLD